MKYTLILIAIFISFLIYAGTESSTGKTGGTEKNGDGCTCHSPQKDLSVIVRIEGPDTLFKGQTGQYELVLSGGPAVAGGFNVASFLGTLAAVDASAKIQNSELTHSSPKSFSGSTVSWQFTFTAQDQVYTDTLYSVANSVNRDFSASSSDKWNFGNKFVVHVVEQPTSVESEAVIAENFRLEQNYPNPFNPGTVISWQSPVSGHQTLKVFDAIGNEVANLVDEYREAGRHRVTFDASQLSSGVYIYRLSAGSFVETKKMLLVR